MAVDAREWNLRRKRALYSRRCKRECEDHNASESWIFEELSNTVAAVGYHRVKPIANPFLANLFFHLFDTAKVDPRSPCASLSGMPARMFSSISISRWERTSWSRSTSSRRDKKRFRRKLRTFTNGGMLDTSLRCFQSLSDGPRNAAPSFGFGFELLQSRLGQSIVFGAAVVSDSPKKRNPTFFFHSVQAGKSEPGLTTKVPPVICWILREIPNPCISPATRISRSANPESLA